MGSTTAAATAAPNPASSGHRIPVVDLRLLSQPELLALSVASSPPSHGDHGDVFLTPKIDRSVFNESAASRKQTYSRLRLAPSASVAAARRSRAPTPDPDPLPGSDGARVVALLELLFGPDALVPVAAAADPDPPAPLARSHSLPLGVAAEPAPVKPKRGRPRKNSSGSVDLRNHPPATSGLAPCGSASQKRKRGRPRKTPEGTSLAAVDFQNLAPVPSCSVPCGSAPEKRKRGRPRKNPIALPAGSGNNPQQGVATESASNLTNTAELERRVVEAEQQQQQGEAPYVSEAEQTTLHSTFQTENGKL